MLLESRAEVNKTDKQKQTPLHRAAFIGHAAVAHLLLQSRADTTMKDQWNDTALATAREEGHEEVVMLLDPSDN